MPDAKRRALISAEGRNKRSTPENTWLNVIITHSKCISSPVIYAHFHLLYNSFSIFLVPIEKT